MKPGRKKGNGICPVCKTAKIDRKTGGYCPRCNALICNIKTKLTRFTDHELKELMIWHIQERRICMHTFASRGQKPADIARTYLKMFCEYQPKGKG